MADQANMQPDIPSSGIHGQYLLDVECRPASISTVPRRRACRVHRRHRGKYLNRS
jgi:hypothetical protein